MLNVLTGLYASTHPHDKKVTYLKSFLAKAPPAIPPQPYFELCYKWIKDGSSLGHEFAHNTLLKLSTHSPNELLDYFTIERLVTLLQESAPSYHIGLAGIKIILMVKELCNKQAALTDCTHLSTAIHGFLQQSDSNILYQTFDLIISFPALCTDTKLFIEGAVCWLSGIQLRELSTDKLQQHTTVADAVARAVQSLTSVNRSAKYTLIQNLVTCMDQRQFISSAVFLLVPPMDSTSKEHLAMMQVSSQLLQKCTYTFVGWPQSENVAQWTQFLVDEYTKLMKSSPNYAQLYTQWLHIVSLVAPYYTRQIYYHGLRQGALSTLERFILGIRTPQIFHNILPGLMKAFKLLRQLRTVKLSSTSSDSSKKWDVSLRHAHECEMIADDPSVSKFPDTLEDAQANFPANAERIDSVLQSLSELLYIQMFEHKGYPELYQPVMQLIKEYPAPSELYMKEKLSKFSLTSSSLNQFSSMEFDAVSETYKYQFRPEHLKKAGLCGLVNLGNTCYLNSIIQALHMTDDFTEAITRHTMATNDVLRQLQLLFVTFEHTSQYAYSPTIFHQVLPAWCRGGQQQDAGEFAKYLFDVLDTAMKKEGFMQSITTLFGGKSATITKCLKCQNRSAREESFFDLTLAFPDNKAGEPLPLDALIQYFLDTELLTGDNRYRCDHCNGLQDAERKTAITSPPLHLMLTLNRFSYDYSTQTRSKVFTEVVYPEVLMLPVVDLESGEMSKAQYALYAVVMHSGRSTEYGHYYAYARHTSTLLNPATATAEGSQWYRFNDEQVKPSSYESFSTITKYFPVDVAYILFYVRCDGVPLDKIQVDIPAELMKHVEEENAKHAQAVASRAQSSSRQSSVATISNSLQRRDDDDSGFGGFGGSKLVF